MHSPNNHADGRGLEAIRERLLAGTEALPCADAPIGPDVSPRVTRAEYTSLCNRLSRMETAMRELLRTHP